MPLIFRQPSLADARAIAAWAYPAPYDFYNWDPADEPELLTMPAAGCSAVHDLVKGLIGFACFGIQGQVPGGARAGLYDAPGIDIGLGLRPDLTGLGLGLGFLEAIVVEACQRYDPPALRLTVAAFNLRARRVYERFGFRPAGSCVSPVRGAEVPFLVMVLTAPCATIGDARRL